MNEWTDGDGVRATAVVDRSGLPDAVSGEADSHDLGTKDP